MPRDAINQIPSDTIQEVDEEVKVQQQEGPEEPTTTTIIEEHEDSKQQLLMKEEEKPKVQIPSMVEIPEVQQKLLIERDLIKKTPSIILQENDIDFERDLQQMGSIELTR